MKNEKDKQLKYILLTMSFIVATVHYASANYVFGNGWTLCAEMTEWHDKMGKNLLIEQWILGYFSGRNIADGEESGKNKDKALYAAVLLDCRSEPLQPITLITDRLYVRLK